MNIFLAFHDGDAQTASNLLTWLNQIGGMAGCDFYFVIDPDTDSGLAMMAKKIGKPKAMFFLDQPVKGWIQGSNALWLKAAEQAQKLDEPWLFLEPDAVPTRQSWAIEIQAEYRRIGKPYMGALVEHKNAFQPNPYLEGCSVYPATAFSEIGAMVKPDKSWTLSTASYVVPRASNSPLFQHLWGEKDTPPTFAKNAVPGTNIFGLSYVKSKTALFHRSKDGSLINLLRQQRGLRTGTPELRASGVNEKDFPDGFILLGRNGDLVTALRGMRLISSWTGKPQRIVCAKQFAPILEGASYAIPHPIDVDWWKGMPEARRMAAGMGNFSVLQCYAHEWGININNWPCYMVSMWERMGLKRDCLAPSKLMFDRRRPPKEEFLIKHWVRDHPKLVLWNCKGISSPFKHVDIVRRELSKLGPDVQVLDLGDVIGERIYDILGIYERADCIVTTDTATLHLAAAVKTPVVGFIVDGWTGSVPPQNTVLDMRYSQVPHRAADILNVVTKCVNARQSKVIHFYSVWPGMDGDAKRRHEIAKMTWRTQDWIDLPITDEMLPRKWKEGARTFPYIRDLFDAATNGQADDTICVFTNSDICVGSDFLTQVKTRLIAQDACYTNRKDFSRLSSPLTDEFIAIGVEYCGTDTFCFRAGWWRRVKNDFPDMLIGIEGWDPCMRILMCNTNQNRQLALQGLTYHEKHGGPNHWEANRYRWGAQKYALNTAFTWMIQHGHNPKNYGIVKS